MDDDVSSGGDGTLVGAAKAVGIDDGDSGEESTDDVNSVCEGEVDSTSMLNIEHIASGLGADESSILDLELVNDKLEIEAMGTFVDESIWNLRIQDLGCKENELKAKYYCRNKIMSVGPKGNQLFYYDLTALAVDINKSMRDPLHSNAWSKVPKNPTQVKEKIVERLLALRQRGPDNKFVLEQTSIVLFLKQIWGKDSISLAPHPNDRVRLYGIVMAIPEFRFALQRLCDGVTNRDELDNPELSLKQIFVEVALAFNNEEVEVNFPDEAYDLEYIHLLDPNDEDRIVIQRDRK